ncbi:testis-specific serine/threonine-protein kinase 3-like [Clytia hemisphaerica]|uniref:Protein kinase domain-containing protein n=1 Tax=Clytia hemisphaerica TaxID=252671 RepID=A0A7M5WUV1_9CNID
MFRFSVVRDDSDSPQSQVKRESQGVGEDINDANKQIQTKDVTNAEKPTTQSDEAFLMSRGYFLLSKGILGEGTYSKVKRAYSKFRSHDVAVKIVNRKIAPKDFLKRFLPRELQIIGQVNHPNICKYYEVLDVGHKVFIIMQHAPRGDLLEFIQCNRFLKENVARPMFLQIAHALAYLHSYNILHRDLKCENILLSHDLKPLLTDFGFAKHLPKFHELNKTFCGSSAYAPIEILKGIPYDGPSAEVWSLGCILYIISTGTMPFDDSNKADQIRQMKKGPNFTRTKQMVSNELRSLIMSMLETNPQKRITLNEIPNQEWSKKIAETNNTADNDQNQSENL